MNNQPTTTAIIVAAGRGTRMASHENKLFIKIHGRPVIAHTWAIFNNHPEIDHIVLVINNTLHDAFNDIAAIAGFKKSFSLVQGGNERQDSVWSGLNAVPESSDTVVIHDGARPLVSNTLISDTIHAAKTFGAAVAAQPVPDTIKESTDGNFISRHLERNTLWAVQTPQTFKITIIKQALSKVFESGLSVTDDTAACALIDQQVKLVESQSPNPKLTRPQDVEYITSLLNER